MVETSKDMKNYFEAIDKEVGSCYKIAEKARKKGYDPEPYVDIPLAKNMAERVEGLISSVTPKLKGTGMVKRIFELEKKYGTLDWRVALKIAEEVAQSKFCKFENVCESMEIGIRVGFAYNTVGVVAAPLEGFTELKIKRRNDGEEYVSAWYSGPIRGAGGTAAAFSVMLIDHVRKVMGFKAFDPTEEEVKRYITEIRDYHERVTNLQYFPSEQEIEFLIKHIPIEISGSPTEKFDVSNYKDLTRIETNKIRGGLCLVLAEGIAQKAKKIIKRVEVWGKEFDLDWFFLRDFLKLQDKIKSKGDVKNSSSSGVSPNYTYIADIVAGRPVLSMPMAHGGFRLRYGRTRTSGFSAGAINPITLSILNKYIAIGTQLKVERPGKASSITLCNTIEGPIIRLKNGSVIKLRTNDDVKDNIAEIEKILFLGDILFNYGDFSENGHKLVPAGYCKEWYALDLEKAIVTFFGSLDFEKVSDLTSVDSEELNNFLSNPLNNNLSFDTSLQLSKKLKIPLAPSYTYFYSLIKKQDLIDLINAVSKAKVEENYSKIILKKDLEIKEILENLGMEHKVIDEFIVLSYNESKSMGYSLGLVDHSSEELINIIKNNDQDTLTLVNNISSVTIKDKAGTFIGARMGRPEKSKMRKLTGSPQVLFPVGDEGGRLRSFQSALEAGKITADFPLFFCAKCNEKSIYSRCSRCGKATKKMYNCKVCGLINSEKCPKHGPTYSFSNRAIDIKEIFNSAKKSLNLSPFPSLIKGVRGTSNKDHIPENIIKGIIRAQNNIYVNKDGTVRYDMTELPITHFKAKEIGVTIEKLKELGYLYDIKGNELINDDQVLEIKPQDIILPAANETLDEKSIDVLFNISRFIDTLLDKFYGLKSFYNLEKKIDIIGHLVIALAPHTSAGVVGRIIGFSETQALFAHPLYHAAMRRDCDGDEAGIMLLLDGLLNFSRQFLPNKIGSKSMDAPLVLTSRIVPAEVDDMVHGMDVVWSYPLEFYEAAMKLKQPWEVPITQLNKRLDTEKQYHDFGYTHEVDNINKGIRCSGYKSLPTMEEKLKGQMDLAVKIRAVDERDVASFVIEKHFLKDTKGNLRKFSMQQFRCVDCSEKFRRPPLKGICTKCGGRIIFTISEGSIVKYLEPSISLANEYDVPVYLKQTLELLKMRVEDVFGKAKEKQEGLGKWFG